MTSIYGCILERSTINSFLLFRLHEINRISPFLVLGKSPHVFGSLKYRRIAILWESVSDHERQVGGVDVEHVIYQVLPYQLPTSQVSYYHHQRAVAVEWTCICPLAFSNIILDSGHQCAVADEWTCICPLALHPIIFESSGIA